VPAEPAEPVELVERTEPAELTALVRQELVVEQTGPPVQVCLRTRSSCVRIPLDRLRFP